MRGQRDPHPVVDIEPFGVVIGLFREDRHAGHEGEGLGEIGEAEVLLSPLIYIWTHTARLEVFSASGDPDAHLDTLLTSIAIVLGVDPALGGEIDQMEIGTPDFDCAAPEGGPDIKAAIVPIRLVYETSNPLT